MTLLGHLGMTGRMFLARKAERLPEHAAVVFDLGGNNLVYEDTRYFGRLTLDGSADGEIGAGTFEPGFSTGDVRAGAKTFATGHQNQIARSNAGGRASETSTRAKRCFARDFRRSWRRTD